MALSCLIFVSRATAAFSETEIQDLERLSAERNAFRDISGALLYCEGIFTQILEGEQWVVRELYDKIARDSRHRDLHELVCRPIASRSFGSWALSCPLEKFSEAAQQRKIRKILAHLDRSNLPINLADSAENLLSSLKVAVERQYFEMKARQAA